MPQKRKPKALKLHQGTDRKDRDRPEADYPPVTGTEPPEWLCDVDAVTEWRARIIQLEAAGVVTSADLSMLGVYCNMFARALMKWRAGGEPTAADVTQLRMMAVEFGFTPASRSKAGKAGPGEEANAFSKYSRSGT